MNESDKNKQGSIDNGRYLPLMEEFFTLQGEGFHTGKPAYFIRIGGCDVGCSWCDTKFSWNAMKFPLVKSDDVISRIVDSKARAVVVTGGEPLMYKLDYFTSGLKEHNIETFIETSGAYSISGEWDWICLSPKLNMPPLNSIFKLADELKMIIQNKSDFKWAEQNAMQVSKECHLFMQPEWSVATSITPLIVDYIKNNQKWRISLQSHKYMKIP